METEATTGGDGDGNVVAPGPEQDRDGDGDRSEDRGQERGQDSNGSGQVTEAGEALGGADAVPETPDDNNAEQGPDKTRPSET